MSFGQTSIKVGDALHFLGIPDLVRVTPTRMQIQLTGGVLDVRGTGLHLLFRHLMAGELTTIEEGQPMPYITISKVQLEQCFSAENTVWSAGECCPVPDDLILLETTTAKDYLPRSTLCFFGRHGRQKPCFTLGFANRSYRIVPHPGEADKLTDTIMASRLAAGTANFFTCLGADYHLPWPEIYRHRVLAIEHADHRPEEWGSDSFFVSLRFNGSDRSQERSVSVSPTQTGEAPPLEI